MARITINLNEELKNKVENIANSNNQSVSKFIVSTIELYFTIDEDEKKDFIELQNQVNKLENKYDDLVSELAIVKSSLREVLNKLERIE